MTGTTKQDSDGYVVHDPACGSHEEFMAKHGQEGWEERIDEILSSTPIASFENADGEQVHAEQAAGGLMVAVKDQPPAEPDLKDTQPQRKSPALLCPADEECEFVGIDEAELAVHIEEEHEQGTG